MNQGSKRRPHLVSLPTNLYTALERRGASMGMTPGEVAKSILTCWIQGIPPLPYVTDPTYGASPVIAVAPVLKEVAAMRAAVVAEINKHKVAPEPEPTPPPEPPPPPPTPIPTPVRTYQPTHLPDIDFDSATDDVIAQARALLAGKDQPR